MGALTPVDAPPKENVDGGAEVDDVPKAPVDVVVPGPKALTGGLPVDPAKALDVGLDVVGAPKLVLEVVAPKPDPNPLAEGALKVLVTWGAGWVAPNPEFVPAGLNPKPPTLLAKGAPKVLPVLVVPKAPVCDAGALNVLVPADGCPNIGTAGVIEEPNVTVPNAGLGCWLAK